MAESVPFSFEERFFAAFEQAVTGFAKVGLDGAWLKVNQKLCEITGYSEEELLSQTFMDITHPEDIQADLDNMQKVLGNELPINILEKRYIRKDGKTVWVHLTAALIRDERGKPHSFVCLIEDINDRKEFEKALRDSQERFNLGLMSSNDGLYDWNLATQEVYWSDRYYEMLGLSRNTFQPTYENFVELIHPEDRERAMAEVQQHLQSREKYTMDYRLRKVDGTYLHILCRGCAIFNDDGVPIRMLGLIQDVTWERTTRESIQRIRQPFQTADELFNYAVNTVGAILKADRCFIVLHSPALEPYVSHEYRAGEETSTLLGQTVGEGFCPYNDRCASFELTYTEDAQNDSSIQRGEEWLATLQWLKIRGLIAVPIHHNRNLLCAMIIHSAEPRHWEEHELHFVQAIADQLAITLYQLRVLEELERASRLKSQFVSNISHELRTPLNAIIGFSEMAINGLAGPLNEKQAKYIQNVVTSGKHLLSLVNDVLDLHKVEAGKLTLTIEPVALRPLMNELEELTQELAGRKQINLSIEIASNLYELQADALRIRQVLLNLLSNGIKFNKDNGSVTVRWWQEGTDVCCQVKDTGVGISEENINNLFSEFYQVDNSLSRKHEGTGLGLALSKRLIELHGGSIAVESMEGVGSTFTIRLPQ